MEAQSNTDDAEGADTAAGHTDEQQALAEFLATYDNGTNQFIITRHEPKTAYVNGQWKKASGHCETLHHYPTPEYIRENWGGGVYEIRVMGPEKGKGMRFKASRRLEVVGDPKLKPDAVQATPVQTDHTMMNRVLEQQFEEKRRIEDRLDRERQAKLTERPPAQDPNLVHTTLGAIQQTAKQQAEMLHEQLTRRDQELSEMRQAMEKLRSERSSLENPEVLKVLFGRNSDDGARQMDVLRHELAAERERAQRDLHAERERAAREVQAERDRALREIDAEKTERDRVAREMQAERDRAARDLQSERERAVREIEAERERALREIEAERREHEKSITLLERLHRSDVENLRASHAQLLVTKDEHIVRLNEEVRAARAQERPHDTLSDLERMGKVVSAVRTLVPGLGGEAPEPPSFGERLLEYGQPVLEKFADVAAKVWATNAAQQSQPAAWPHAARPQQQFLPGGIPAGASVAPAASWFRPAAAAPTQRPPAVTSGPSAGPPQRPSVPPTATVTPQFLSGLSFVEAALKNNQPASEVARTATSMFSKAEVRAFCEAGADRIGAEVEAANPDSILASPAGRRFVRELIDALSGTVETA